MGIDALAIDALIPTGEVEVTDPIEMLNKIRPVTGDVRQWGPVQNIEINHWGPTRHPFPVVLPWPMRAQGINMGKNQPGNSFYRGRVGRLP